MPSKTIQATIVNVGDEQVVKTARGGYKKFEIAYKSDGKLSGKTLVDYANPEIYKAARALQQGQTVSVTLEKQAGTDGKEYWNWTAVGEGTSAEETPQQATSGKTSEVATKPTGKAGGNWETAEERAARQVYIIRQSSGTLALALLQQSNPRITLTELLTTAEQIKDWVLTGEVPDAVRKATRGRKAATVEDSPDEFSMLDDNS